MTKQKTISYLKLRIIIVCAFAVILLSTMLFYNTCEYWINSVCFPVPNSIEGAELKVHFIDVDQGDSILIEFPDNKTMLVDAGPNSEETKLINYINNNLPNKTINYFVATHQDEDHIGGADKIFENFNVLNFYRPNVFTNQEIVENAYIDATEYNSGDFINMINGLKNEQNCESFVTFPHENLLNLNNDCPYSVKFLAPLDETSTKSNDYSAVIMIEYLSKKILLTGDADAEIEQRLINLYGDSLKADILKVAHHGSSDSTSINFMSKVKPTYAVISVGKNNSYGHPTQNVLQILNSTVGTNIYRTDIQGNIVFGIKPDNNQAQILIKTQTHPLVVLYIKWWTVVIAGIILCTVITFSIKTKKA